MRVLSQTELSRCTTGELSVLLNRIAAELPNLREGSSELPQRARELAEYPQGSRAAGLPAAIRPSAP